MMKSPAGIRRETEENIRAAREITGTPRVHIPDALTTYRGEQQALIDADEAEKLRRVRAAKLDQMARVRATAEIDIDERVRVAVAREVGAVLDTLSDAVGSAIGELLKQNMQPIATKLAEVERALDKLQSLTPPAGRAFDSARLDIN